MAVALKSSGKAASIPGGLASSSAVSLTITILGALLFGKMIDIGKLQWENIGYGIMVLLLAASFLGAWVACARIKRQRMMICALSALLYLGILLSITALFFGGQYEAVGVTSALVFAGSGSAGLLGMREKRGGKRRKTKYRLR